MWKIKMTWAVRSLTGQVVINKNNLCLRSYAHRVVKPTGLFLNLKHFVTK